jgi:hypothetical protein
MDYHTLFAVVDLACTYLKVQNRRVLDCRQSRASNFQVLNLCALFPAREGTKSPTVFVRRIYRLPLLVASIF